jgi:hypothetical protein
LPGFGLEMANTERDQEKRRSCVVVMRLSLCPSFGGAHTAVGSTGLWVSHKLLAGLHPNQFLQAPPWKVVVVTLWWAEELGFKPTSVLQVKRPFSKWRDPDSNRAHHDFQIGPGSYGSPP